MATPGSDQPRAPALKLKPVPRLIFMSRWLQLPLYLGLIVAQGVYVYHFWVELIHLLQSLFGSQTDAVALICGVMPDTDACSNAKAALAAGQSNIKLNETLIMLVVLGLIDVVMISNLLIMVIVGGYETFVSRLNIDGHPDQPEWLSHVNASVLKVKLGMAIIGISSIHLLKTFINAEQTDTKTLMWQTLIHLTFLASALAIAWTDRIISHHYEHE